MGVDRGGSKGLSYLPMKPDVISLFYEQATNDLRGVIRDGVSPSVIFRIQRRWLVDDGQEVRLEWRDLPVVTEEQVRAEGLTTSPQEG